MIKSLLITIGILLSGFVMAIEEPEYEVLEKDGDYELREYQSMIVAETFVEGSMGKVSNQGFRRIASYIFGGNKSALGDETKIAMTAPVTVEMQSEKIAMTSPVTMEQQGNQWRIHFVMPKEYELSSLPTPNNADVKLREIAARKIAVLRFSGWTGEAKVAEKTNLLLEWLAAKGIQPNANPQLARYNPPWTLPFMRRNEILIPY